MSALRAEEPTRVIDIGRLVAAAREYEEALQEHLESPSMESAMLVFVAETTLQAVAL